MEIRLAKLSDIAEMRELFEMGRQRQIASGNLNQWYQGYPSVEILTQDIESGSSYVCVDDNHEIIGSFYLLHGEDPTYQVIEGGAWLNNAPYVTIHRFVVKYGGRKIGQRCLNWVMARFDNIKIDTHEQNVPMRKLLMNNHFEYCGIIYLADGRERVAYQWAKDHN